MSRSIQPEIIKLREAFRNYTHLGSMDGEPLSNFCDCISNNKIPDEENPFDLYPGNDQKQASELFINILKEMLSILEEQFNFMSDYETFANALYDEIVDL